MKPQRYSARPSITFHKIGYIIKREGGKGPKGRVKAGEGGDGGEKKYKFHMLRYLTHLLHLLITRGQRLRVVIRARSRNGGRGKIKVEQNPAEG